MSVKIAATKFLIYMLSESFHTFHCQQIKETDEILLTLNNQLYTATNDIFAMLKLDKKFGEYFRIKPLIVMHRDLKQISEAKFKEYKDIEIASKLDNDIGNQLFNMTAVLDIIFDDAMNTSSKTLSFRRHLSQIGPNTRIRNGGSLTRRMTPVKKKDHPKLGKTTSTDIDEAINHLLKSLKNLASILDHDSQIANKEELLQNLKNTYDHLNRTITSTSPLEKKRVKHFVKHSNINDDSEATLKTTHKIMKKQDKQQLIVRPLRYTPPARGAAAEQSIFDDDDANNDQTINRERKVFGKDSTKTNRTEISEKPLGMRKPFPNSKKIMDSNNIKNHDATTQKLHNIRHKHNENYKSNISRQKQKQTNTKSYRQDIAGTTKIIEKPVSNIEGWVKEDYFRHKCKEDEKNLNYTIDTVPFRARDLNDTQKELEPISKVLNKVNKGTDIELSTTDDQNIDQDISTSSDFEETGTGKDILDYVYVD